MSGENSVLATKYRSTFDLLLVENEFLENAGESIHVEISDIFGRGRGDGVLGVANRRIIFIYHDSRTSTEVINRSQIVSVKRNWIITPGSSNVAVIAMLGGVLRSMNFYVGTSFSRELVAMFGEPK